jgi:hypothetical protein
VPAVPKPVSFRTARIGAAILAGFGFAGMVALFVAMTVDAMHVEQVAAHQALWLFMIVLSSVPLFAAHGTYTTFVDAYAQGKFHLPPSAAGQHADTSTNPWRGALIACGVVGLPVTALAYVLIPRAWPHDGLSPSGFSALIAGCSGLLAGAVTFAWTGRTFLREVAVPQEGRSFRGSLDAYIWQRHAIPQFLINAWFNAWAALSLVRGPVSDPSSNMPREGLMIDAFVTAIGLALGIAAGTRAYASFDLRWGVVVARATRAPSPLRIGLMLLGGAVCTGLAIALVLFGLGVERLHTWPLVAWRGLLCGSYAGSVAYWCAHWSLSTPLPSSPSSRLGSPPMAADAVTTTDPAP